MRRPRIREDQTDGTLERVARSWKIRYGLAVVLGMLPCATAIVLGGRMGAGVYSLILFAAILGVSVLAGFGPGLLSTALGGALAYIVSPRHLTQPELLRLTVEGLLVSCVGGTLRATRIKSREHLKATLRLERQILEIGDDERRRIGHDLHDGLGQHLTGISLLSETVAQQVRAGEPPDPANVETITALVSEAVSITRNLAKSLSPVTLECEGFVAAVEELADTISDRFEIQCTWDFDEPQLVLGRTRSMHLYRIVQEAVNNSIRHGKAKNISIRLRRDGQGSLTLTVVDDGTGLSEKTAMNPGLGLRIMQYRARMLGAALTAERHSATRGTIVQCCCPPYDEGSTRD